MEIQRSFRKGRTAPLVVLPTGAGKTVIFGDLASQYAKQGKKILILAHRRNLVYQTAESIKKHYGLDCSILMADVPYESKHQIVIASKDTYIRRVNADYSLFNPYFVDADYIIIDEAHRAVSKGYLDLLRQYKNKRLLGFTATPARRDGRGLGLIFDDLLVPVEMRELIKKQYLIPIKYYVPRDIDLSKLKLVAGDYNLKDTAERVDKADIVGDIPLFWSEHARDRKTLIFAVNVKHSKHIQEEFQKYDIPIAHLDANSTDEERENVFNAMESGKIQVITNVGLYVEGMDVPNISCVIMARPTKSLVIWRQAVGRGMRIAPGKKDLIVMDFAGIVKTLGRVEDVIDWSLNDKQKAWDQRKINKKTDKLIICRTCKEVYEKADKCPRCGTEVKTYGKDVNITHGKLVALEGGQAGKAKLPEPAKNKKSKKEKYDWKFRLKVYQGLLYIARKKGYKQGWAAYSYKEIFDLWPYKGWKHEAPEQAKGKVKGMITHLMIKRSYAYKGGKRKLGWIE